MYYNVIHRQCQRGPQSISLFRHMGSSCHAGLVNKAAEPKFICRGFGFSRKHVDFWPEEWGRWSRLSSPVTSFTVVFLSLFFFKYIVSHVSTIQTPLKKRLVWRNQPCQSDGFASGYSIRSGIVGAERSCRLVVCISISRANKKKEIFNKGENEILKRVKGIVTRVASCNLTAAPAFQRAKLFWSWVDFGATRAEPSEIGTRINKNNN